MIDNVLPSMAFFLLLRKKSLPFKIKNPTISLLKKGEWWDFHSVLSPLRAHWLVAVLLRFEGALHGDTEIIRLLFR